MTRLEVNINDETALALRQLAALHNTNVTEVVRRAVSVYKFVSDETGQGKQLIVRGTEYDTEWTLGE